MSFNSCGKNVSVKRPTVTVIDLISTQFKYMAYYDYATWRESLLNNVNRKIRKEASH